MKRERKNQQNTQNFELKIQKIQKQIQSLSLDIKYLLKEKSFQDNIHKILLKQKRNIQNCFLFKNGQRQYKQKDQVKNKVKNIFKDANQRILQYSQLIQKQISKNKQNIPQQQQKQIQSQNDIKLSCQSLHLKQIFNPQADRNHEETVLRLKEKLKLLYQKIRLNLDKQQPYVCDKILERIKRQARRQSKLKIRTQIQKLIKQNSKWIKQQRNIVENKLQQQEVQQICMNNLGLMKKIMSKKVSNNDFIFQNYSNNQIRSKMILQTTFPIVKIHDKYNQILSLLHQQRISQQLYTVRKTSKQYQCQNKKESLTHLLSDPTIQSIFISKHSLDNQFEKCERNLLEKCEQINQKLDKQFKK